MQAGAGFVTGGGWIYLDSDEIYVHPTIVNTDFANGTKATFGFNAKHNHNGQPDGSTNFGIEGNHLHFHSETGGNVQYDYLDVPNREDAIWTGKGHLTLANGNAKEGDVYSFLVTVQDKGEPGNLDTWRIRIWETDSNPEVLIFDTNPLLPTDPYMLSKERCWGTELGETNGANGGGNIQIHKSKMGRTVMMATDALCVCDDEGRVSPSEVGGGKFVTGGGWIMLNAAVQNTDGAGFGQQGDLELIKANFGFNAKFKKADMTPDGSTNFDHSGGNFHFHTSTGGATVAYEYLEVKSPTEALWMGTGTLDLVDGSSIDCGFLVAVQDHGIPGTGDTWRLRIWDTSAVDAATLTWVDTADGLKPVVPDVYIFDTNPDCPCAHDDIGKFGGTELGSSENVGGGNIQIHWKADEIV
jgi:hypothetical protein